MMAIDLLRNKHAVLSLFFTFSTITSALILPSIHWTPFNPIFQADSTMKVFMTNRVTFVCPNPAIYTSPAQESLREEILYENMWLVNQSGFNSCDASRGKLLMRCDQPLTLKYYSIVFQEFSASPSGLEFEGGKEYFFIATSNGTKPSLPSPSGGHCSTHGMKMAFYICTSNNGQYSSHVPTSQPTTQNTATTAPLASPPQTRCLGTFNLSETLNKVGLLPSILNNTNHVGPLATALSIMDERLVSMETKMDSLMANLNQESKRPCCNCTEDTTAKRNCVELYKAGHHKSGVYAIDPDGQGVFPVFCDQSTDGGGWIVISKRQDGSQNFSRPWDAYRDGFGLLSREFWLGLEKVYRLTKKQSQVLRVDLKDYRGESRYAQYSSFSIGGEETNYRMSVSGYDGTAGDSLIQYHNGRQFSTTERDNDQLSLNCAETFGGAGWWYSTCFVANLNGFWANGTIHEFAKGIIWKNSDWKDTYMESLPFAEMKIRPT